MQVELDLSICIIVQKQIQAARKLLRSIYETADPVAFEVYAIDMAQDGQAAQLLSEFSDIKLFQGTGKNFIGAYNHTLRLVRGRYTGLFDHDIIVQPGCLKRLVDFMDDNPDVGICGPTILNAYGKVQRSARRFSSMSSLLAQAKLFGIISERLWNNGLLIENWGHKSSREIDWLCSGVHIIRHEVIDEVGFLDTHSFSYEQDYYLRARNKGWHNYFVHEAEAVHPNPGRYDQNHIQGRDLGSVLRFLKRRWFK